MIVICGEYNSGKTHKVVELLDFSKQILYFSLDFDKRIKAIELKLPNIRVEGFYRKPCLNDLESIILQYGGFLSNKLNTIVIDPINYLNFDKKSIKYKLSKIKELENKYNNQFNIIITLNKLHHFEMEDIEISDYDSFFTIS